MTSPLRHIILLLPQLLLLFFLLLPCRQACGQVVGVKSDLLAGALTSPNLAVEVAVTQRFSAELDFHYNPFPNGKERRWKHWLLEPAFKYWLCQPFGGHYFGIQGTYGWYNVGNVHLPFGLAKELRYLRREGSLGGISLTYGYHWILSPRWGIETSIGLGYIHTGYDDFRCFHCGEQTGSGHKNYVGPTKVAVSLIYMIK